VFVTGGWNVSGGSRTTLDTVEEFDPASDTWSSLPPLNVPRLDLGAAAVRCPADAASACLYAVGGDVGANDTTATVEELQPNSSRWQLSPALDPARDLAGVVATDCTPQPSSKHTCIYSIGGMVGLAQSTDQVDMYDPSSGLWRALPAAPAPIAAAGVTTGPCQNGGNRCIYVVGGYGASPAVPSAAAYRFEPDTGAWQTLPPLPAARSLLAAAPAPCRSATGRTCVYALDGLDSVLNIHHDVFVYDPISNAWSSVASTPLDDQAVTATGGPCVVNTQTTCLYLSPGVFTDTLDMYDPHDNRWLALASSVAKSPAMTSGPCSNDPFRRCIWLAGGWGRVGTSNRDSADVQEFDPANDDGGSGLIPLQPLLRPRSGDGAAAAPCQGDTSVTCVYTVDGGTYNDSFTGGIDWSEALEMARPVRFMGATFTMGATTL
jgi:hypothetical protein